SSIAAGEAGASSRWHLEGEQAVQGSGLAWTVLRPSMFASNTLSWASAIQAGLPAPDMFGGARQGVIDPRDVAAVAVRALTSAEPTGTGRAVTANYSARPATGRSTITAGGRMPCAATVSATVSNVDLTTRWLRVLPSCTTATGVSAGRPPASSAAANSAIRCT